MNDINVQEDTGLRAMQSAGAIMPASVNAGAVSIEIERAVAEARGQMQLAKMFPRNVQAARAELMEACKLQSLASIAFYTLPQGGQKVTGPSIKLIEQIASTLGNIEWGHRELSRVEAGPGPRDFGRSEIEVYAWDKEKNTRSIRQITVLHVLDTREGPRKLRDQRDIDNKIANIASKQMRGRLQALLPKWLIEAASQECRKTIAGDNERPMSERVALMVQKFVKFGVTTAVLETYLGHGLDTVLADELVDLHGIYTALNEGGKPSEYFDIQSRDQPATEGGDLNSAMSAEAQTPKQPPAQPAPAPATTRRAPAPGRRTQAVDNQTASTQAEARQAGPAAHTRHEPPQADDTPPDEGPIF